MFVVILQDALDDLLHLTGRNRRRRGAQTYYKLDDGEQQRQESIEFGSVSREKLYKASKRSLADP